MNIKFLKNIFFGTKPNKLDNAIRWLLISAVAILPWFFIPAGSYPIEYNKVWLFNIIIFVSVVLFLVKIIVEKKGIFIKTYLDKLIAGLVIFYLISFIFSKSYYFSLVGVSGLFTTNLFTMLSFAAFFYLLINIIKDRDEIWNFVFIFSFSGLIVVLFNIFQAFGIFLLPWEITRNFSFNALASSSLNLSIFSGIILFLMMGVFLSTKIKWKKYLSGLAILATLFLLMILSKVITLYILLIVFFAFLILVTIFSKKLSNWWVVLPTIILTLLALFIFLGSSPFSATQTSESVALDHRTSLSIGWKSFTKTPLWGSGPQTFIYDFANYRPADFNDSALWNIRFVKPSSEWLYWLATVGGGGALIFLVLVVWHFIKSLRNILKSKQTDIQWQLSVILTGSWMILGLSFFLLPFNFLLYFTFWMLLALSYKSIFIESSNNITFNVNKKLNNFKFTTGAILASSILLAVILVFGSRIWIADYKFAKAQSSIAQGEDINATLSKLQQAVDFNNYDVKYYLNLAQGYATKALLDASDANTTTEQTQATTQQVVDNIKYAKLQDPINPIVYETEAALYDNLRNLIGNVDELSYRAYLKAVELEPNHPLIRFNLGRSRLLLAQTILSNPETAGSVTEANSLLDQAINDFQLAKDLKDDLIISYFNLGLAYQMKGELDKAIESYNNYLSAVPNSLESFWQLALIYEEQGSNELALENLNKILTLAPDHVQTQEKIEALNSPSEDSVVE